MRYMQISFFCGVLICLNIASAHAHGVVGQRKFIEPFIAEDANPKNEFVFAKPGQFNLAEGNEFTLGYILEKRFSENFSIALENEWVVSREAGEENTTGFQNLGVLLKYSMFKSEPHEFIISSGFEVGIPVGDEDIGAERDVALEPLMLFGKGFGDLPQSFGFLRPFALMGDAGFDIFLSEEETETEFFYDIVLMYDLQYLQTFVKDIGIPWPLDHLVPLVEFNFETVVNGPERGTEAFITPGLVYRGDKYFQLGVAGQFPLNSTTNREFNDGILFIIDIFYDDIFPALTWTPFSFNYEGVFNQVSMDSAAGSGGSLLSPSPYLS